MQIMFTSRGIAPSSRRRCDSLDPLVLDPAVSRAEFGEAPQELLDLRGGERRFRIKQHLDEFLAEGDGGKYVTQLFFVVRVSTCGLLGRRRCRDGRCPWHGYGCGCGLRRADFVLHSIPQDMDRVRLHASVAFGYLEFHRKTRYE